MIDQVLWDRAQARLAAIRESPRASGARTARFWERRNAKHLLTGKVFCAVCDGPVVAVGRDYLACGHAHREGTCSNRRSVRRSVIENVILDGLKSRLMAPELVKEFTTAFHEECNRQLRAQGAAREMREHELIDVRRRLDSLIDAIANGLRAPALQAKLDELEHRKSDLEHELSAPPPTPLRIHPNLAELYRHKVSDLANALADPETRTEALEILRGLVERIVVQPVDGGLELELIGEIANMVDLGSGLQSKTAALGAAVPASYRSSVKVVAGTGFEPVTFRL